MVNDKGCKTNCPHITYHGCIAVLWFKKHHCGITYKAYFTISNVRGDSQCQV